MRELRLSAARLVGFRGGLAVVGKQQRVGRVQVALVVALFGVAGMGAAMNRHARADETPPVPTIEDFQVSWEEDEPENNTYKFTFSGSIRNCGNLLDPTVRLYGYPFNTLVLPSPSGAFSYQVILSGDDAFGRTIVATITDDGHQMSEESFTST